MYYDKNWLGSRIIIVIKVASIRLFLQWKYLNWFKFKETKIPA